MSKRLLCCFIALMATSGPAWPQTAEPVVAAQIAVASPVGTLAPVASAPIGSHMATMDLSPMPLVSRSLTGFGTIEPAAVADGSAISSSPSLDSYDRDNSKGLSWLFEAIIEPFYLSLLGASLLLFGTVKRRGS